MRPLDHFAGARLACGRGVCCEWWFVRSLVAFLLVVDCSSMCCWSGPASSLRIVAPTVSCLCFVVPVSSFSLSLYVVVVVVVSRPRRRCHEFLCGVPYPLRCVGRRRGVLGVCPLRRVGRLCGVVGVCISRRVGRMFGVVGVCRPCVGRLRRVPGVFSLRRAGCLRGVVGVCSLRRVGWTFGVVGVCRSVALSVCVALFVSSSLRRSSALELVRLVVFES